VIVLDSSFLIGFYNDRDAHHPKASSLIREFLDGRWGKGLLLEYVYLEVVTVLMVRADLAIAASVAGILLESEELELRWRIETVEVGNTFSEWSESGAGGRSLVV
jgi:predicted nucleic acid-binding protein